MRNSQSLQRNCTYLMRLVRHPIMRSPELLSLELLYGSTSFETVVDLLNCHGNGLRAAWLKCFADSMVEA